MYIIYVCYRYKVIPSKTIRLELNPNNSTIKGFIQVIL